MHCPVCKGPKVAPYSLDTAVRLFRCAACGLKFQDAIPDEAALSALYDAAYYEEIYPERHFEEQKRLFGHRLAWLEAMAGPGRLDILEIGSGRGVFLEAALERGHAVTGQDLSGEAVRGIRERLGVPALEGPLEDLDLSAGSFDLVHMNHVLEHIPDPLTTLIRIRRLLRPGGLLYVEVPRQSNLLNRLSGIMAGKEFGFTYHPGHLYLFSPASLRRLLHDAGLPPRFLRIEGMLAPHRFVRHVHYHSAVAHLVKLAAGGLRLERWLGGGNLVAVGRKSGQPRPGAHG